ncbi:MAG: restriction endonuclease [Gammaproteobacteria bacterium]|nr:restriction endonuclease [Gammaproteobacteria bacterium]MDH5730407.1 restriction endonuclease [Gammaproteobacteria bacterium]
MDSPPLLAYDGKETVTADGGFNYKQYCSAIENSYYGEKCPYCNESCRTDNNNMELSGAVGWQSDKIAWCVRCGWWSFQADQEDLNGEGYFMSSRALLKQFLPSSKHVPVEPLQSYIHDNPSKIQLINPAKFEELVASIYSELLGYRVESCSYGRPDLGIDVVVVNTHSGEKIAVQVKRYKNPIELGLIHQFYGALIDGQHRNGVFVTSGRYRSGAIKTANRLSKMGVQIDLVDGKRFLEFLNVLNYRKKLPTPSDCPYWKAVGYNATPGGGEILGGRF